MIMAQRRPEPDRTEEQVVWAGPLAIYPDRFRAPVRGERIDLTPFQLKLLITLARRGGQVVPRRDLLDAVHDEWSDAVESSINQRISDLRQKLAPVGVGI